MQLQKTNKQTKRRYEDIYFNEKTTNVKCHTENYENVNLLLFFFHCKLYAWFFLLPKLYIQHYFNIKLHEMSRYIESFSLHIVREHSVNQLTGF